MQLKINKYQGQANGKPCCLIDVALVAEISYCNIYILKFMFRLIAK
jgi:hypothetical protein